MNTKTILIVMIASIIGIAGLFGIWKLASTPKEIKKVDITFSEKDHIKGNKDAKVTLVEFSDFQCPACGAYFPIVKQVYETKKDKMRLVYKHFPLAVHKNADEAGYASEAASTQGKFWEMHDMLFSKQSDWSESDKPQEFFEKYAKELKLDMDRFKKDYDDKAVRQKVDDDLAYGTQLLVNGTPTFYLNGVKLDPSPRTVAEFEKLIDDAGNNKTN